jgi:hypothetical protein
MFSRTPKQRRPRLIQQLYLLQNPTATAADAKIFERWLNDGIPELRDLFIQGLIEARGPEPYRFFAVVQQ